MARSYVALSLNEKLKVIEAKEKDKLSVREIMIRFKCGKTQIYEALKHKERIINEWMQGKGQMKRMPKKTNNEEINEIVWDWFTRARSKNMRISGPMLQSQALAVAKSLGNDQFKASSGWLDSFKKRHNIVWNRNYARTTSRARKEAEEAAERALAEQQTLPVIKQEPGDLTTPSNYAFEPTEEHIKDEIIEPVFESELIQVKEEVDSSLVEDEEHRQEVDPFGAIQQQEECREDFFPKQHVQVRLLSGGRNGQTAQQVNLVQPDILDPVSVMFLNFAERFRAFSSKRQLVVKSKLCQVFAEAELEEMQERQQRR